MDLLIKNALLDGKKRDLLIKDGLFCAIEEVIAPLLGVSVFDANGLHVVPPFYNCHTHSPMNLLRGGADDLELMEWLTKHIWPREAKLTAGDIRDGAFLAVREMIRTGTCFFNDMYWRSEEVLKVAADTGIRANIGIFIIEECPGKIDSRCLRQEETILSIYESLSNEAKSRIQISYAPHAIYTVSEKTLTVIAKKAARNGLGIHVHASETKTEFDNCAKANSLTPIELLDRCGILTPKTILAHCVHLTEGDMALIKERGAIISHQPVSNYKLCSGQFRYHDAVEVHHCRFVIGTDGAASNNSLSFFDEMKMAALNAKIQSGLPTSGKAEDIFFAATRGGADAFGINGGEISVGKVGDALFIRSDALNNIPCTNLTSNIVYSCDTSSVSSMVVGGRLLLEEGRVLV